MIDTTLLQYSFLEKAYDTVSYLLSQRELFHLKDKSKANAIIEFKASGRTLNSWNDDSGRTLNSWNYDFFLKKNKTRLDEETIREYGRVQVNLGVVKSMIQNAYTPSLISILNNKDIRLPYTVL